jgi:hypothetical protein
MSEKVEMFVGDDRKALLRELSSMLAGWEISGIM